MEVYVKVQNIKDVDAFFKVIDECKGTVELVSPEGDRINLKSKLTQYLSMANIFSNGYIKELDLVAHDKDDVERLIKFMYRIYFPKCPTGFPAGHFLISICILRLIIFHNPVFSAWACGVILLLVCSVIIHPVIDTAYV